MEAELIRVEQLSKESRESQSLKRYNKEGLKNIRKKLKTKALRTSSATFLSTILPLKTMNRSRYLMTSLRKTMTNWYRSHLCTTLNQPKLSRKKKASMKCTRISWKTGISKK